GSVQGLAAFREQTRSQLGAETAVVEESAEVQGQMRLYRRVARYEKFGGPIETVFGFDAEDRISTFFVRPVATEAASEHLDYLTQAELRLPFEGEWYVFWGGRSVKQNYHAATKDQRFAYDIVVMREGSTHVGDGKRNEDYHCFGQPILAPAAGTVVAAIGDLPDNVPGQFDRQHPAGNHVVLDLGNGEYALFAHFRQGSLKVGPGDKVEAGAPLAECGNSGNSSEPHLHFHLQEGPELFSAVGLPAQFQRYLADGAPVERGEPVKGQTIAPQPKTAPPAAGASPDAAR
ncbi:MAG TPA: M23 family metallopeptidase, partial [Planctomycetota bacterium]|nr:M23 family metallopeptidase [Planctomycetota bacterium]